MISRVHVVQNQKVQAIVTQHRQDIHHILILQLIRVQVLLITLLFVVHLLHIVAHMVEDLDHQEILIMQVHNITVQQVQDTLHLYLEHILLLHHPIIPLELVLITTLQLVIHQVTQEDLDMFKEITLTVLSIRVTRRKRNLEKN